MKLPCLMMKLPCLMVKLPCLKPFLDEYHLVMTNIAMDRSTIFKRQTIYKWAISHGYVSHNQTVVYTTRIQNGAFWDDGDHSDSVEPWVDTQMVRQSITKLSRCTSHQHGRRTWLRILRLRYVSVVEVGVSDNGMGWDGPQSNWTVRYSYSSLVWQDRPISMCKQLVRFVQKTSTLKRRCCLSREWICCGDTLNNIKLRTIF